MYTSVPRAHHWTVFAWRGLILREVKAPLAPVDTVTRAGTGFTSVATEAGQGFGTVPATIEGALSHVCWTWQSWFAELHCTWSRGGNWGLTIGVATVMDLIWARRTRAERLQQRIFLVGRYKAAEIINGSKWPSRTASVSG